MYINANNKRTIKILIYKFLYIIFIILVIVSTAFIIKYFYDIKSSNQEKDLLNTVSINDKYIVNIENNLDEKAIEDDRISKLKELKKENNDIVGWIEIKNTNINYPVLQGNNNDFYMNHNYKKEYSLNGSIFLDSNYNWNTYNMILYGHNMKNGTMFQNLLKYNSFEYYKQHSIIRFTTEFEDAEYVIISAFYSKVYYKTDKNVFKYYNYTNIDNKEDFENFVKNVKSSSLYNTNEDAFFGDKLITLSTCSYHTDDGRFVVVGRKK